MLPHIIHDGRLSLGVITLLVVKELAAASTAAKVVSDSQPSALAEGSPKAEGSPIHRSRRLSTVPFDRTPQR